MRKTTIGVVALAGLILGSHPADAVTYYGPWASGKPGNTGSAVVETIGALRDGSQDHYDRSLAALGSAAGEDHRLSEIASDGPVPRRGLGFGPGTSAANGIANGNGNGDRDGVVMIASTPLPPSLLLLGAAICCMGVLSRRRAV